LIFTHAEPGSALNIKAVSEIEVKDEGARACIKENLRALEKSQDDDELKEALQTALNRPQWPRKIRERLKRRLERLVRRFP
jgi:hypothetical protein